jgi:murein DD-endopeptidase MepM/ murein hydrolase activator NlpD
METLLLLASLIMPVQGPITQFPTPRHPAIDIACTPGTPIVAAHGGQMVKSWDPDMGNVVTVVGLGLESTYSHLEAVYRPRLVIAGEEIGTCGTTGRLTTGPHLHFAVWRIKAE